MEQLESPNNLLMYLLIDVWIRRNNLIKYVLSDANNLIFRAGIDQNDQSNFNNHSQLLEHISNELIPICDSN